jgi:soluble cytochrome b562
MRLVFLAATLSLVGACVPHRDVPVTEVPKLAKLVEVMDVQGTVMDPQFKKIGQATYGDADWTAFADAGARIQATSMHIKDFSKGPAFDALAMQLNAHAKELADAAGAKDAAAASKALAEMKATCKTCHKQFK